MSGKRLTNEQFNEAAKAVDNTLCNGEAAVPIVKRWAEVYDALKNFSDGPRIRSRILIEELSLAEHKLQLQKGSNMAQDEREASAAKRLNMVHSCDWPDQVADMVQSFEAEIERLKTEASHSPTTAFLHELSAEHLLGRAVRSARSNRKRKREKHPRWVAVHDNLGLGSTYSQELCEKFGLDPDEEVSR